MKQLTPDRYRQIESLLDQLYDLPPEAHAAFLKQACDDDPTLYYQLQIALDANQYDQRFLSKRPQLASLIKELQADFLDEPSTSVAGRRIGPYILHRTIARGGMGRVLLAQRADGTFDQQVALKLLRWELGSEIVEQRFLTERQILAQLRHEHIARLLDGGVTDEGQPYFVMEYIDGTSISNYCDTHRLDVEHRLRLFMQVCRAVHYAHSNLVVHRDLKPSNILVTEDTTGAPVAKLVDFGIAKLLSDEGTSLNGVPQTRTGQHMMTPEYAAPEQVRQETITTATDIYALGVILYELLTGQRPYRLENYSLTELERVICQQEPTEPSTALVRSTTPPQSDTTTAPTNLAAISQARNTTVERLRRALQGDLDKIVLMALRKEPDRRYASAEQFEEDIQRYLTRLPVRAQRDTLLYRSRKFVQRYRTAVLALAAMLVLVTSLVGYYTTELAQERDRARIEADKATTVSDFLTGLFQVINPDYEQNQTINVQDLLKRGERKLEELDGQPEIQAQLMTVLGKTYLDLRTPDKAEPLLNKALALRQDLYGDEHTEVAKSLHAQGLLHMGQGNDQEADSLFRQSLALHQKLQPENDQRIAQLEMDLGWALNDLERYEEAETLIRRALAVLGAAPNPNRDLIVAATNRLGMALMGQAAYDEAEPVLLEALRLRRELYGESHWLVALSLSNLGGLYYHMADYDSAATYYQEALAIRRQLLGNDHEDIAQSLHEIATVLYEKGDYAGAVPYFQESLEINRKKIDGDHRILATIQSNLAAVMYQAEQYDEAEQQFREAMAMRRRLFGNEHSEMAYSLYWLGRTLHRQGRYQEAERLQKSALQMRRKLLAEDHPDIAYSLYFLSDLLIDRARYAEAEEALLEALAIRIEKYGQTNRHVFYTKLRLGKALTGLTRFDEAEALLLESYTAFQEAEDQKGTDFTREALHTLYVDWGKPDQAARYQ